MDPEEPQSLWDSVQSRLSAQPEQQPVSLWDSVQSRLPGGGQQYEPQEAEPQLRQDPVHWLQQRINQPEPTPTPSQASWQDIAINLPTGGLFMAAVTPTGIPSLLRQPGGTPLQQASITRDWPEVSRQMREQFPEVDPEQYRGAYGLQRAMNVYRNPQHDQSWNDYARLRLPFVGAAMNVAESLRTKSAAERIRDGEADDKDYARVARYLTAAQRHREQTEGWSMPAIGNSILDVVSHLPGFAVEFGLTAGAFSAGRVATTAGVTRLVGQRAASSVAGTAGELAATGTARQIAGRLALEAPGFAAGTVAQTTAMPHRIAQSAAARAVPGIGMENGQLQVEDRGSFAENLPAGALDQLIEIGSERSGAALLGAGGVLGRIRAYRTAAQAISASPIGRFYNGGADGIRRLTTAVGAGGAYHGTAGEMFEERVGETLRGLTGLTQRPDGTPDYGMAGDILAGRLGDAGRQLLVEAVGFAALPVSYGAISATARRIGDRPSPADGALAAYSVHLDTLPEVERRASGENMAAFRDGLVMGRVPRDEAERGSLAFPEGPEREYAHAIAKNRPTQEALDTLQRHQEQAAPRTGAAPEVAIPVAEAAGPSVAAPAQAVQPLSPLSLLTDQEVIDLATNQLNMKKPPASRGSAIKMLLKSNSRDILPKIEEAIVAQRKELPVVQSARPPAPPTEPVATARPQAEAMPSVNQETRPGEDFTMTPAAQAQARVEAEKPVADDQKAVQLEEVMRKAKLTEHQKEALRGRFLEGKTQEEIGAARGVTRANIQLHEKKALAALKVKTSAAKMNANVPAVEANDSQEAEKIRAQEGIGFTQEQAKEVRVNNAPFDAFEKYGKEVEAITKRFKDEAEAIRKANGDLTREEQDSISRRYDSLLEQARERSKAELLSGAVLPEERPAFQGSYRAFYERAADPALTFGDIDAFVKERLMPLPAKELRAILASMGKTAPANPNKKKLAEYMGRLVKDQKEAIERSRPALADPKVEEIKQTIVSNMHQQLTGEEPPVRRGLLPMGAGQQAAPAQPGSPAQPSASPTAAPVPQPASEPNWTTSAYERLERGVREVWDQLQELAGIAFPRMSRLSEKSALSMMELSSARDGFMEAAAIEDAAELDQKAFGRPATEDERHQLGQMVDELRLQKIREFHTNERDAAFNALNILRAQLKTKPTPYVTKTEAQKKKEGKDFKEALARHDDALAAASNVKTYIGGTQHKGFAETGKYFPSMQSFLRFLATPEAKKFREGWKEKPSKILDKFYREAEGHGETDVIDNATQISTDEIYTLVLPEATPGKAPPPPRGGERGDPGNVKARKLGAAKQALGNAEAYETDIHEILRRGYTARAVIAKKAKMLRTMQAEGVGEWGRMGALPNGRPAKFFDQVNPPKGTQANLNGEKGFSIDAETYKEMYRALGLADKWNPLPFTTILNHANLASTMDAVYHIRNQFTNVMKPGVLDYGILPITLIKNTYGVITKNKEIAASIMEMAKMGYARPGHPATGILGESLKNVDPTYYLSKYLGGFIHITDQAMRKTLDDAFTKLTNRPEGLGKVKDTPKNRADFINGGMGNYSHSSQHALVSLLRQLGVGPFATAGTAFYVGGARAITFSPGVKAASMKDAIALRGEMIAKTVALLTAVAITNYLRWGRPDGDEDTPLGAIKIGEADGKTSHWDLTSLFGLTRGARQFGLMALLEGGRRGSDSGRIVDKASHDVFASIMHPAFGPAGQFVHTAMTGENGMGMSVVPRHLPEGGSHAMENLKAALRQANPGYAKLTGAERPDQHVPWSERLWGMAGPYAVKYRGNAMVSRVHEETLNLQRRKHDALEAGRPMVQADADRLRLLEHVGGLVNAMKRAYGPERQDENVGYANGLARAVLGQPESANHPNPLRMIASLPIQPSGPTVPGGPPGPSVQDVVRRNLAEAVNQLATQRPRYHPGETRTHYTEAVTRWEDSQRQARQFIALAGMTPQEHRRVLMQRIQQQHQSGQRIGAMPTAADYRRVNRVRP